MSKKLRERCAKKESQHKMRLQCQDAGETLVINTVFQANTVLLARREQHLDIPLYTATNICYCKFWKWYFINSHVWIFEKHCWYNVVARTSAKYSKSTGYNLIAIVGICMQIFLMPLSQSILIFHYPLW